MKTNNKIENANRVDFLSLWGKRRCPTSLEAERIGLTDVGTDNSGFNMALNSKVSKGKECAEMTSELREKREIEQTC